MSYWSGLGGGITVNAGSELPIHSHTVRKTSRLVENSHSGVTATNFEHIIPHYEWTIRIPWDDTRLPDTDEGLNEGAKVTIKFDDGGSGKFCTLTNTSVETLEEEEDVMNNIIMAVVSGKGGTLTRQVT